MNNQKIHFLFSSLEGSWVLERTIVSFEGTVLGTYLGKATYKPTSNPNLLHYREEGQLKMQDSTSCAFKDYYFLYKDGIELYFDSNLTQFFYKMEFLELERGILQSKGIHYCGKDVYKATFTFNSSSVYMSEFIVEGPRKNYIIKSEFRKLI